MIKWKPRWQDRALLYVGEVAKKSGVEVRISQRMFFVALCDYALKNDCMCNGKLTVKLSVTQMCDVCNVARSSAILALRLLTDSGAITRTETGNKRISPTTIINFVDGEEDRFE